MVIFLSIMSHFSAVLGSFQELDEYSARTMVTPFKLA